MCPQVGYSMIQVYLNHQPEKRVPKVRHNDIARVDSSDSVLLHLPLTIGKPYLHPCLILGVVNFDCLRFCARALIYILRIATTG